MAAVAVDQRSDQPSTATGKYITTTLPRLNSANASVV